MRSLAADMKAAGMPPRPMEFCIALLNSLPFARCMEFASAAASLTAFAGAAVASTACAASPSRRRSSRERC